jgi:hypothetical protein
MKNVKKKSTKLFVDIVSINTKIERDVESICQSNIKKIYNK